MFHNCESKISGLVVQILKFFMEDKKEEKIEFGSLCWAAWNNRFYVAKLEKPKKNQPEHFPYYVQYFHMNKVGILPTHQYAKVSTIRKLEDMSEEDIKFSHSERYVYRRRMIGYRYSKFFEKEKTKFGGYEKKFNDLNDFTFYINYKRREPHLKEYKRIEENVDKEIESYMEEFNLKRQKRKKKNSILSGKKRKRTKTRWNIDITTLGFSKDDVEKDEKELVEKRKKFMQDGNWYELFDNNSFIRDGDHSSNDVFFCSLAGFYQYIFPKIKPKKIRNTLLCEPYDSTFTLVHFEQDAIIAACTFSIVSPKGVSPPKRQRVNGSKKRPRNPPITEPFGYIHLFGVHLTQQGTGFGSKLLEIVKRFIKAQDIDQIFVSSDNKASGFYKKSGFKRIGIAEQRELIRNDIDEYSRTSMMKFVFEKTEKCD